MGGGEQIDLARAEDFRLGRVIVRPALRLLLREDGVEDGVESRVMQVLIALARANGGILRHDVLAASCWERGAASEGAVARTVSRLRRIAEGIGAGSFRIETVDAGYRLIAETYAPVGAVPETPLEPGLLAQVRQLKFERRAMLIGGGVAVAGAAAGVWVYRSLTVETPPPREVAPLMEQAIVAAQQGTAEDNDRALTLLRRVVAIRPDYADGWGMLAIVSAAAALGRTGQPEADLRARSHAAAGRARALEGGNAYASVASVFLDPYIGNWWAAERSLRTGLIRHPRNQLLLSSLAGLMLSVGRCAEAVEQLDAAAAAGPRSPALLCSRTRALWAGGRPEEAERTIAEAQSLYPRHSVVWRTRFDLLLYTGRAQEALAMGRDAEARPAALPKADLASIEAAARAMLSRAPADIDAALAAGAGSAEDRIQLAAGLGRLDTAFEIVRGYYFDERVKAGPLSIMQQRVAAHLRNRRTHFLFYPSTAPMRADRRFALLAGALRLTQYWVEKGAIPDYQRAK